MEVSQSLQLTELLTSGGPTMFWNLIEKRRAKKPP